MLFAFNVKHDRIGSGPNGQVWQASPPPSDGLTAVVDYVNHKVSVSPSPVNLVVRVASGIKVDTIPGGLRFSVEKGYNVIPVYDPQLGQLGYFRAPVPPEFGTAKPKKQSRRPKAK